MEMTLETTTTDTPYYEDAPEAFGPTDSETRRAADVVAEKREAAARERPSLPEEETGEDPELTRLEWKDGRPKDKPVSTKEAADSYAQYREQRAREIMESLQLNWDAEQAEQGEPKALHENQVEQQPEKSQEQQWSEWYESLEPPAKLQVQAAAQFEQHRAAAETAAQGYTFALSALLDNLNGAGAQFSDIKTVQDLERVARENPQRVQQMHKHLQTVQAVQGEAQRFNQARAQEQAQAYQQQVSAYKAEQEKVVSQLIPELREGADPEAQRRLQQQALETLKEAGFSDHDLYEGWNLGRPVLLTDARAQLIISQASKYRALQKGRGEMMNKRAPAPKLMRPGRASDVMADHSHDAAMQRFQRSHSVDDAVAVYRARQNRS
jgi:hypothetical protein